MSPGTLESTRRAIGPRARGQGYAQAHRRRANLLIHLICVPVFVLGNVALVVGLAMLHWPAALAGAMFTAASLAVQGYGHRREPVRPEPFHGPFDFALRILAEQWISFPRFVLSGGWAGAWRRPKLQPHADTQPRQRRRT